jgi:hypothetical protein
MLRKFELQSPPHDFTDEVIREIEAMSGDKVYSNQKLKALISKNLTAGPSTGFTYSVLNQVRPQGRRQDHYPPIISKKAWASIIAFVTVCLIVSVGLNGEGGQVTELFVTPIGNYLITLTSKLLEPLFYLGVITLSVGLLLLIDYFFRNIQRSETVD